MAIWSIVAAPLIMGNDPRNISAASKAILTNAAAIAIDQDALGQMGLRLENSSSAPTQRWVRMLANGDVAVGQVFGSLRIGRPPHALTLPLRIHNPAPAQPLQQARQQRAPTPLPKV